MHKVMLNCKRLCILYMIDKQENTGHESKGNCIYYLTDNDEGMKKLIAWFVNEVMQEEAEQQAGAERYQRTSSRKTYRNGHRKRTLKTRYGEVILNKPQLRDTPFQIKVFEQYSRTGKAVENTILDSYLQGVSTRKIQVIVAHSGVGKISASYISKIATESDHKVHQFLSRPIETDIPYPFADASYFKVRDGIRYIIRHSSLLPGSVMMDTGESLAPESRTAKMS